jgi:hypothetical protein
MPSSYTPRLRLEMQAAGENLNTWGAPRLNNTLARIDFALAGRAVLTLTGGDYRLSSQNGGEDEARSAMLDLVGQAPARILVPAVSKIYLVRNRTTGPVQLSSGAGTSAEVGPGDVTLVACDGADLFCLSAAGRALKTYVDQVAWSYNAGNLPGQSGQAGKVLKTDGLSAAWTGLTSADITDANAERLASTGRAIAFALTL